MMKTGFHRQMLLCANWPFGWPYPEAICAIVPAIFIESKSTVSEDYEPPKSSQYWQ